MVSAIGKIGKTNLLQMRNWPDRISGRANILAFYSSCPDFWHNRLALPPYERVPMIDRKYQKIVFAFFMALLMSCVMSFVITLFNVGFISNLVSVWLKAWAFAFVVAFPTISVVAPLVQKLVGLVLKDG
jgi:hypothetical protein